LLHALLGIDSFAALGRHPKLGSSWEGFAMEEVLRLTGDREAFFWAAQSGAELDLLVFHCGKRYGFEFKHADSPALTKSLHVARHDLKLEHAFIVTPGTKSYALDDWVEVIGISDLHEAIGRRFGEPRRSTTTRTRRPRK
jgi:hypothetical protein